MYSVFFDRDVEKDLANIPKVYAKKIVAKCLALAQQPRPVHSLKLEGVRDTFRLRVGDYRVIYQIDDKTKHIVIYHVRHRQGAYRGY